MPRRRKKLSPPPHASYLGSPPDLHMPEAVLRGIIRGMGYQRRGRYNPQSEDDIVAYIKWLLNQDLPRIPSDPASQEHIANNISIQVLARWLSTRQKRTNKHDVNALLRQHDYLLSIIDCYPIKEPTLGKRKLWLKRCLPDILRDLSEYDFKCICRGRTVVSEPDFENIAGSTTHGQLVDAILVHFHQLGNTENLHEYLFRKRTNSPRSLTRTTRK